MPASLANAIFPLPTRAAVGITRTSAARTAAARAIRSTPQSLGLGVANSAYGVRKRLLPPAGRPPLRILPKQTRARPRCARHRRTSSLSPKTDVLLQAAPLDQVVQTTQEKFMQKLTYIGIAALSAMLLALAPTALAGGSKDGDARHQARQVHGLEHVEAEGQVRRRTDRDRVRGRSEPRRQALARHDRPRRLDRLQRDPHDGRSERIVHRASPPRRVGRERHGSSRPRRPYRAAKAAAPSSLSDPLTRAETGGASPSGLGVAAASRMRRPSGFIHSRPRA